MATYYKYAERSAGSQVNWAEIGKNLTDTLNEENKLREQKKAEIEEATRQYGLTLENAEQGEFKPLNQWALDYASDAQEARLLQDRLLRQGKLKLRDYTMMRQNLTDGTNQAFDLIKEYNAEFKVKMERAKGLDPANSSQYLERWLLEQAEGFANFTKSKLYINPTNFAVNVARNFITKDGVTTMSDKPDDYTTVNDLRNRIKSSFDKFNSDAYLKSQIDLLGEEQRAIIDQAATKSKTGFTKAVEDQRLKEGFDIVQNLIINKAFTDPNKISSVLTEDLGGYLSDPADPKSKMIKFDYTWDETKAGKVIDGVNYILLTKENNQIVPQFSDDQKKLAEDYMRKKMNSMIDYKETMQGYTNPTPPQVQQWQVEFGKDKNARLSLANMLLKLKNGTQEEVQAAVDYFRLVNPKGIKEIARWGDPTNKTGGISYITADGELRELTRSDNDADWIRAATGAFLPEGTSLDDVVDQAIKASGGTSTWDNYGEIANRAKQVIQPAVQDTNTNFFNNIVIPGVPGSGGGAKGKAAKYSTGG